MATFTQPILLGHDFKVAQPDSVVEQSNRGLSEVGIYYAPSHSHNTPSGLKYPEKKSDEEEEEEVSRSGRLL